MSTEKKEQQGVSQGLSEHEVRLEKVKKLHELGIAAWPVSREVSATCKQVLDEYVPGQEGKNYTLAGRLMAMREHGKTMFVVIQDRSGRLQIYVRQDLLGDQAYQFVKDFIDIGDVVWVKGHAFTTKTGEITLKVEEFSLLSKCLHPLPEKFHGLADVEAKYRQRYLDLISDPETKQRFVKRSKITRLIRDFLDSHDFIEVETPMLQPIPGGAAARPFVTHHNALDADLYLRIAPELYLKRLVVGGLERVYEINRNFRNEGISTRHNPEFTMLEFYLAHNDYHYGMDLIEGMIRMAVKKTCDSMQVPFGAHVIDFEKPFERIAMKDAVLKYGGYKASDIEGDAIDAVLKKHPVKLEKKNPTWGEKLYALFDAVVESQLIQPTFITSFPVETSPLSKRDPQDPSIAARFELFIAGMELGNGYTELNDPLDQAARFKEQAAAHASGDIEAHLYDADFVLALEHGLPPTVGVGLGIDRLVMLLTNTTSIRDVVLFPTLKRKEIA